MGEGLQELTSEGRRGGHVQREGKKEVFACCRREVMYIPAAGGEITRVFCIFP